MDNTINNTPKDVKKNKEKLNTPATNSSDNTGKALDKSKLKKPLIITLIAVAVIAVLALTLLLIFRSSPIGKILSKLEKSESYKMTATVSSIPFVGSITLEQKVDENITYTSAFLFTPEQYKEIVGEDTYIYKKSSSGKWTKTKSDGSGSSMDDTVEDLVGDLDELTNPKNYEKVKGEKNKYKQKDSVTFDGCKDVVITIGEDDVTVEMTIDFEGMEMPATVVISEIGEVELTLPEVE